MELLLSDIENVKNNAFKAKGKDYEKIIRKVHQFTSDATSIKNACEHAKINYHSYYNAKRFFTKHSKKQMGGNKNNSETSIFKKKEKEKQSNDIMEMMHNMKGRGGRSKHSGMTDIIEEANKKNNIQQNKQQDDKPKKKVKDANELFNVDGFLDKIENEKNY